MKMCTKCGEPNATLFSGRCTWCLDSDCFFGYCRVPAEPEPKLAPSDQPEAFSVTIEPNGDRLDLVIDVEYRFAAMEQKNWVRMGLVDIAVGKYSDRLLSIKAADVEPKDIACILSFSIDELSTRTRPSGSKLNYATVSSQLNLGVTNALPQWLELAIERLKNAKTGKITG